MTLVNTDFVSGKEIETIGIVKGSMIDETYGDGATPAAAAPAATPHRNKPDPPSPRKYHGV